MKRTDKQIKRYRRHKRVRAKIHGTAEVPRLCLFRSNKHLYAQLVDDEKAHTLAKASDFEFKKPKTNQAFEIGKLIAKKAITKKITKVIFDKGGYKYQGRVKAVAEGAREGGLKF